MSGDIGYTTRSLDDMEARLLNSALQNFPKEVKHFMTKQGNEGRKILRSHIRGTTNKITGSLLKGIKRGKVWQDGEAWQVRVYDKAHHAGPVSSGHMKVLWGRKTGERVAGKDFFESADREFQSRVSSELDDFLDSLLERGLS